MSLFLHLPFSLSGPMCSFCVCLHRLLSSVMSSILSIQWTVCLSLLFFFIFLSYSLLFPHFTLLSISISLPHSASSLWPSFRPPPSLSQLATWDSVHGLNGSLKESRIENGMQGLTIKVVTLLVGGLFRLCVTYILSRPHTVAWTPDSSRCEACWLMFLIACFSEI